MLGVNYWPAAQAMNWLRAYDPAITRHDFASARSAGFDTIRVFLRWEDAQPTPTTIDPAVISRLVDAADAAVEAGVRPARHAFHRPHERRQLDSRLGRRAEPRVTNVFESSVAERLCLPRPACATGTATWPSSTHRSGWRPPPPRPSPAIPASGVGISATRTRTAPCRRTRPRPKRGSNECPLHSGAAIPGGRSRLVSTWRTSRTTA